MRGEIGRVEREPQKEGKFRLYNYGSRVQESLSKVDQVVAHFVNSHSVTSSYS